MDITTLISDRTRAELRESMREGGLSPRLRWRRKRDFP